MDNEKVSSEGSDGSRLKQKWRGALGGRGRQHGAIAEKNVKRRKSRVTHQLAIVFDPFRIVAETAKTSVTFTPRPPNPTQSSAANNFAAPHPPFPAHPPTQMYFFARSKNIYISTNLAGPLLQASQEIKKKIIIRIHAITLA